MINKRGGQDVAPLCAFALGHIDLPVLPNQFPNARGPPLTLGTDELPRQQQKLGQAVGPR
jgi:hypothetical protein